MREIKFRAWNKKAHDYETGWAYPSQMVGPGFAFDVPDHIVLMQYTGLKDKNGKEIYEGDKGV
jgi:hypothetical protein